jgi:uncharacterized protein YyaL (SSP411 family)
MTSAEDVAREWLQCSDSVVMFGSAETIDTTVQSLAAIIARERNEADARAEAAEAESARLLACLNQIFVARPVIHRAARHLSNPAQIITQAHQHRSNPMPHLEIQISAEAHTELKRQATLQAKQMKRLVAEIVERALLPLTPPPAPPTPPTPTPE